jgi:hypothetical protein
MGGATLPCYTSSAVTSTRTGQRSIRFHGKYFVPILYRDLAFEPFDDFSDFVKSVSYGTSKTCQVRGSNPCRGATDLGVDSIARLGLQDRQLVLFSGSNPTWPSPAQGQRPNLNSGSGVKRTRTSPSWRAEIQAASATCCTTIWCGWRIESGLPGVVDLLDVSNHGSGKDIIAISCERSYPMRGNRYFAPHSFWRTAVGTPGKHIRIEQVEHQ